MVSSPTPSTAPSEGSSSSPHPDEPPHPVHSIYPIFVPAHLSDDFIHAFAGATAGFASGVVTCPLDVIKTKLQAQGGWSMRHGRGVTPSEVVYRGLFGTANKIWSDEGFRGMYRGLGPLILGYLPTWTVYFTVYEKTKGVLEPEIEKTWVKHILSAMTAGASSTICTNPIWVIKTRLMAQSSATTARNSAVKIPYHYTGTLDAMRKMYAHEGIRSFYSGLAPALLGLTHVAVQFPLYEQFKKMFTGGVELGKQGKGGKTDFWGILAASCLSKICASSATYPHEVVRTRLQTQRIENGKQGYPRYRGIVQSFKTVFRDEGWRGFYAGMGTNMIRAVPASAMTLLTYELMVGRLTLWKNQGILERDERSGHGQWR